MKTTFDKISLKKFSNPACRPTWNLKNSKQSLWWKNREIDEKIDLESQVFQLF